jgi:hypothetical protein
LPQTPKGSSSRKGGSSKKGSATKASGKK